jgi:hypothetical protein
MKLVKGSAEAKAYMAKIRGMKGSKGVHKMPDGSIMKDSEMKMKHSTSKNGRFVKGSKEAKEYMAKIRSMKK